MPTFRHGKNVKVYVDEFDFSSYFNDVSASTTVETAETTNFGSSAKEYIPGLKDGSVSLSGLFESTNGEGTDSYFDSILGETVKQNIIIAEEGHALGNRAVMLESDSTSYEVSAAIADVVQANAEFQSSEGLEHGVVLSSGSAIDASGNENGVSNDAATTNGGVGFVSIPSNTRNGDVSIKIQQSADGLVFTDLITFTTVSSATKASERVEVVGTIEKTLRVSYTVAGSTGSATPIVAFSRR